MRPGDLVMIATGGYSDLDDSLAIVLGGYYDGCVTHFRVMCHRDAQIRIYPVELLFPVESNEAG